MYIGFNLKDISIETSPSSEWNSLFEGQKKIVRKQLSYFTTQSGIIDGEKIQNEWFPEMNAQVFISHSHADEELAISFACWLYDTFGIIAFIDSCVWGYANDLLKQIDNEYCKKEDNIYDYDKRNHSTSHVHVMLMMALNKMIDKTECVFLLNTNNSVFLEDIKSKTLSPWIYGEIEITNTIEKRKPKRHLLVEIFSKGGEIIADNLDLQIANPANTDHLIDIDMSILKKWKNENNSKGEKALDELYRITGILKEVI